MIPRVQADYLVIGSGIAGLRAAIELAPHGRVLVLTKAEPGAGSTGYAQGGIAAAVGPDDSVDLHAADTLRAGDGLCDERAVEILVTEGARYVRELVDWGCAFDRDADGKLDLAREAAHSVRRVLHAKDATGREIARVLGHRLSGLATVEVIDHAVAVQLVLDEGVVTGVRYVDRRGSLCEVRASATLLATGGAGQLFRETTNPHVASGDGVTLAYLSGAAVADLEFVQFHPTVLSVPGAPRYLLSEALRGEGAWLVNNAGERFMSRYEAAGELAPRDRVARALVLESERTGAAVYLSMAHLPAPRVQARFPGIASLCRSVGLDLASDRLPVSPAAHYLMGGVATDVDGRSSLKGLFAAGEVARTGVHGANRLASNSLLEGLVFGGRAGEAMRDWRAAGWPMGTTEWRRDPPPTGPPLAQPMAEDELRRFMWTHAGVFRDGAGLSLAHDAFLGPWHRLLEGVAAGGGMTAEVWRSVSLLAVGHLVLGAALRRTESRGGHQRTDFPGRNDLDWTRTVRESLGPARPRPAEA